MYPPPARAAAPGPVLIRYGEYPDESVSVPDEPEEALWALLLTFSLESAFPESIDDNVLELARLSLLDKSAIDVPLEIELTSD